jgi:hypothetical protein
LANRKIEGFIRAKTGLDKEIGRVDEEWRPAEELDDPRHAGDLGAAELNTLEAIQIRIAAAHVFFHFVRMSHHGDRFIDIKDNVGLARQSDKRVFGLFQATVPDKPPRGFWSEVHADQNGNGPEPLKRERDAVGPLRGVVDKSS